MSVYTISPKHHEDRGAADLTLKAFKKIPLQDDDDVFFRMHYGGYIQLVIDNLNPSVKIATYYPKNVARSDLWMSPEDLKRIRQVVKHLQTVFQPEDPSGD